MALKALTAPNRALHGLNEVYVPPDGKPEVDIILLHGLNGAPERTWTEPKSGVFWPGQLLPQVLEEESIKARVLVYGYDARNFAFAGDVLTSDGISEHAQTFLSILTSNRGATHAARRPIILLGHSLGGIVIKLAMHYAEQAKLLPEIREIFFSTYGIVFVGTPHRGSQVAKVASVAERWRERLIPRRLVSTTGQLLADLQTNAKVLHDIDDDFMKLIPNFKLMYFWEMLPISMPWPWSGVEYVVAQPSAAPLDRGVERSGLEGNHFTMIKFDKREHSGFKHVSEVLVKFARQSLVEIPKVWAREDEIAAAASQSSSKILPADRRHSNASTQTEKDGVPQILFFPPQMRRNTFFVGRKHELIKMEQNLFNNDRDEIGTSAIVLRGQAGVGKSHLARQYVFNNMQKFPGGIFWIHCKLEEEVSKAFWDISQKYVCKPDMDADPSLSFIDNVRIWFESRSGWLLVFDGLDKFEDDETIENFKQYIPDSRKSYIIFASRTSQVKFAQRLLHPEEILVKSLKTADGTTLLLDELNLKNPSQTQFDAAAALVRQVNGLPLAIHAISHRINDSNVRLQDYKLTSYASFTRIANTYTAIFDDLYRNNHREAVNLANIICFFASQIPVGLIRLGEKGLANIEIKTPSGPGDRGPLELDNTLTLLRNHALIERNENENDDNSGTSTTTSSYQSGSGSQTKSTRASGDIIVMHSVVRSYCCDRLNDANSIALWMTYAVRTFEEAYKAAHLRMKAKTAPARLSDYREFLIHGQQLQDNLKIYSKARKHDQELESLKSVLKPVVDAVKQEIKLREPGSSSDSIANVEFQPTVFEEPSSSSGSGESSSSRTSEDSGNDLSFVSTPSGSPLEHRSPTGYYSAGTPYRDKDYSRADYFLNTAHGQLAAPYTDSMTVITPATPAGSNGQTQWSARQSLERLKRQTGLLNLPPPRLRERPPSIARTEPVVDTDMSPRASPQLSYAKMVQQLATYDPRPFSISYSQSPPIAMLDRQQTEPFRPQSIDTSQRSQILRNASYFSNPDAVRTETPDYRTVLQSQRPRPILDPRSAPFVPSVGVVGSAPAYTRPPSFLDRPSSAEGPCIDPTTFPLSRTQSRDTMSPARSAVLLHNPGQGQQLPRAYTPQGSEGRSIQHTRAHSVASIDSHLQWPTLGESMRSSRHSDQHEAMFEFEQHHEPGYHSEAMSRSQSGQSALQAQDMSRSQSGPSAIQYGALPPIDTRVARQRAFEAAHPRERLGVHHNTNHPSSFSQSRSSSQNPNMRPPALSTASTSQAWGPLSVATNSQPWGSASTPGIIQSPASRPRNTSDASILPNLDGGGVNQHGQTQNNQRNDKRMSRSEM